MLFPAVVLASYIHTVDMAIHSLQDQYSADLYHFATKEEAYANYFIRVSVAR